MRVFKMIFSTCFCVSLLALCAFLPKLTAAIQEYGTDQVMYVDMEPLSLDIREMTPLEKLGCFTDSSVVYLPDDNAITKREDLPYVIASEMALYQDVGLVSMDFDFSDTQQWSIEAELAMCYNIYAPQKNAVFWFVQMSSAYYGESNLQLVLDDSTGAILLIDFETMMPSYSPNIPYDVLMRFYITYFERLGVPLERVTALEIEPVQISKSSVAVEFGWDDETFGRMVLNFQVYERGFFVMLAT